MTTATITTTTTPASTDLLTVHGVTKAYGTADKAFTAVKDIDLRIAEGEFVCLLGPSGCGKSTLLRIIAGLMPATSGEVLYCGRHIEGVNPYATIVFQTFALFPWLTVEQNVTVALKARGVDPPTRHATRCKSRSRHLPLPSRYFRRETGAAMCSTRSQPISQQEPPRSSSSIHAARRLRCTTW